MSAACARMSDRAVLEGPGSNADQSSIDCETADHQKSSESENTSFRKGDIESNIFYSRDHEKRNSERNNQSGELPQPDASEANSSATLNDLLPVVSDDSQAHPSSNTDAVETPSSSDPVVHEVPKEESQEKKSKYIPKKQKTGYKGGASLEKIFNRLTRWCMIT